MGWNTVLWCALWLLCTHTVASPRSDKLSFVRSAVETVPEHDPIPAPIRASVESIPLRSLRDEGDERLPLRDAVEKRPIEVLSDESLRVNVEDVEDIPVGDTDNLRQYYGAANYLNKFQLGNANLQEMQQTPTGPATKRLIVCYVESWAAYRVPPLAFTAGLVPQTCTHLHYAFAVMHPHTYALMPANEDYDIIKGGYRIAAGLKRRKTGLKVMLSVGGDGTDRLFSEMVQESNRRSNFIDSAVSFLREHDFDGLDLHWIYPGERDEEEKDMFTSLLYELREKMSPYGLLLATVLPPFRYQIEDGYDLAAVSGAADYVTLQAWDMTHGKRDEPPTKAVQHSALHRDPGAASRDQRYDNIEFMVKYILRHGMAPEKLVLGVPLFGRSYTLASSTLTSPGAPISGWGQEGPYTQTKGLLAYFEICIAEREGKGVTGTDEAGNAYAVFDDQWVTYDSQTTIAEKMRFVMNLGLAGAAAWAIDMDDFRGLCGSPFPLLSTISTMLSNEPVQSDQSSLKIGSCESMMPYLASDEESCAHFHFCTGGINFRMVCEDERLYDPSTGFCGHQDVTKCLPGQSLRISVEEAARLLPHAYDNDFEWSDQVNHDMMMNTEPVQLISMAENFKKKKAHQKKTFGNHSRKRNQDEDIFATYNINSRVPREGPENNKRVVCYMTSWAFYRRGDGKFVPEQIDTRLCTHIVYAYGSLSPDELVAKEFDPWTDITNNLYERVTSLKDVTVLLGLGGWTDSAGDKYSRLVSSSAARTKFTEKLVSFLRMHNFRGLHLDWNYPVCWQSNCKKGAASDKANYAKLIQELSKALHGAGMELGVAISGYKEVIEAAYDLATISKAADFLSAMTYDYHGGWESTTAHHTPLVPSPKDTIPHYSIEYAVKALISGGADPKKILLGLSFYGQTYRLATTGSSGPGSAASGPGEPGEFTKQPGMMAYYEICYRVKNLRWKTGRQDRAGPYAYSENQWVGYDDPKSITEKVEWAMRQGLGGVTAWAMDLDDFNNRCCGEPWPLLRAAGRALGRPVPQPAGACERPPQPITPPPPTTTTVASDGSAGGDHVHPGHDHPTTQTTWPAWKPESTTATTAQTWWSQPTTMKPTSTTPTTAQTWWSQATTTTMKPTTTVRTTTTRRATTQSSQSAEGKPCTAGEYREAAGDCESYLQCEGGVWRKHRCAPGLHWSAATKRCDWPSFAKCSATSSSESTTATSTLAPITARPPPRPTTTSIPTTTTRATTTTRRTTTSTTTTTRRPTTEAASSGDSMDGTPCNGQTYKPVAGDCNAYLHCDGSVWRRQRCAPGLHWSPTQNYCDWPKYAKCESSSSTPAVLPTRTTIRLPTRPPTTPQPSNIPAEDSSCGSGESMTPASTCDAYLLCVGGRWRKQQCPPGLHWDKRTNRCDWAEFAMCDVKPGATKTPPTSTKRPQQWTTSKKPTENLTTAPSRCQTGTYHPHPQCEKFYVCVNGQLVAQSCAPGLVWGPNGQCDFPRKDSCGDRRNMHPAAPVSMQLQDQTKICENGEYAKVEGDCTRYRHCLFGKFEEFPCSAGLHWNEEKQICDWPKSAKCKSKSGMTTTRPMVETPSKPAIDHEHTEHFEPARPVVSTPTPTQPEVPNKPSLLKTKYKVVCYYTNWAWYRPGLGKYGPEDIDPTLCTHIVYGFAVLGSDGLITAHDSWADYDNRLYERVVEYKRYGVKVSLALGGWNDSEGDKYSKLVNDPIARARFVTHAVQFIETYNFDGLDLDWEYPKCWQVDCSKGPDSDKEGFSDLVRELSALMKPKGLLLSSAVSPNKKVIDEGYDVPVLARYLDWIAVMTYDYHGQWDKKTGHVAPLYYHPDDDTTYFNANYTIHYWMSKGAPSRKLVMGIPMYGQTFTTGVQWDTDPDLLGRKGAIGLNVPAVTGGEAGEYTRAKGFLAYYEICDRIRNQGWIVEKDPHGRMGPYAYKGNQWVGFDDIDIVKQKTEFIKSLNLGGGMIWALDLDDFRNRCGQGKHPLLNTIKKGLLNPKIELEPIHLQPTYSSTTSRPSIDDYDDLDDIEVRPGYNKPTWTTTVRPMRPTSQMSPIVQTTKKPTVPHVEERYKVVCYYTNWAWYRPGPGKYTPSDIDPSLCTHVVYAFAVLDADTLVMKPHDTSLDIENKFYEKVTALKSRGVRVVIGLGGWNDSAGDKYSRLVNNPSARKKFVVHAIDFIEQFGFDGLDLDWEYPKCWQVECEKGPYSDKQGFASLIKELRSAFDTRGLLLSTAVSGSKRVIDYAYDVPTLSKNLDWIALMTYDYHGQWDKKTGHIAPMYAREDDDDSTFNANFTVNYWIQKGAARQKLVLGVPMYGQSFSLLDNSANGLSAPADAGGDPGDETRARGFLAFYEICERIRVYGWRVVKDYGGRMGPYATRDDQWVSFDDDFMARHKAEYARAMGLGGNMVWALDLDDFTGQYCGCGKSPLLSSINHVLRGKQAPPPCELQEVPGATVPTAITEGAITDTSSEVESGESAPAIPEIDSDIETSGYLDGRPCSGMMFKGDDTNCNKYYLCFNGVYMQLTCPDGLLWNGNHCDEPHKSRCRTKTNLRITAGEGTVVDSNEKPIVGCYFTDWAYYRRENGSFGPDQLDVSMCTHVIYAWAHLDKKSFKIMPGNSELDVGYDFYGKVTSLRHTGVKVILGVGGLEDSEEEKWHEMASTSQNRKKFSRSVYKFLRKWNFDGLQIAWQYPGCHQVPCSSYRQLAERDNFSSLLIELSQKLRSHAMELSAMVAASPEIASTAYDHAVLKDNVDWLAIAANDYYTTSSGRTGYLVPLETTEQWDNNFNATVEYWSSVVPGRQLVLGIPAYARTYSLRTVTNREVGAPVFGPGAPGPFTGVPGFLAYHERCAFKPEDWHETRTRKGTYAVYGSQWASYLLPEEVHLMTSLGMRAGLRGAALWAMDLDDWRGACSCVPRPLLTAMKQAVHEPLLAPSLCI
ncbi:probable chitinase 10 isoform X1 [Cydia pomonella]|uniref:probable chitinase 10 isoform X1 n=1 Tax=Cydia pomonella TaxID=82600 RepID=UPI002ADD3A99|nr:probable chitinase 10 isoform X1 [Cydia pomonella]XP_061712228.1 probable chitinase 10 isoform X1 [Cydia pomonella]